MIFLGISQDRYDSGATLTDGNRVLYAVNEERLTRKKTQGGFPYHSIDSALRFTGVDASDVGCICVAGLMTPPLPMRAFPKLHYMLFEGSRPEKERMRDRCVDFVQNHTPFAHTSSDSLLRKACRKLLVPAFRRTLPQPALRKAPIHFVEHHHAHAASAWFLSGMEDVLCVTGDGMGDGLSLTISRCSPQGIERLWSASSLDSLGILYEMITESFGFIPCRHEGKVMGLAAHGDPARVREPTPFSLENGRLRYTGPLGRKGVVWAKEVLGQRYDREDIAAWVQQILESMLLQVTTTWLRTTKLTKLVVAGGIFANVKLNQRLHELDEVDKLFVCPNMGDGGLSLGAISAQGGLTRHAVGDVFWGDQSLDDEIRESLEQRQLQFSRCDNIDVRVAELVAEGRIVARFCGRMEWGPRALGNRSVLAGTVDPSVVGRLNDSLRRSDFMPFAPAVLDEDADAYFVGLGAAGHAARFMTACFDATQKMRTEHPAVVHVDSTVRPQVVGRDSNPSFHRLLTAYKDLTGSGVMLNTSFNIHEEPIVRTAGEAVNSFLSAGLDYLAIEDYLVPSPQLESANRQTPIPDEVGRRTD